ncbi:hypothetical protein [Haloarchaeobius sp. DT45]|uniref:hypothetical protein n=1 Tax=Haloarchaeobius sp. DT45 TaxID=3446116 RepID=UPI003F6B7AFE
MGGMFDGIAGAAGDFYDETAGALDKAAGSTDEAVARTFDDEPGGGLYDGAAGWLDHAAGPTDEAVGGSVDYLGEGVSGLWSLVDSEPGNTAGPGEESWEFAENAAEDGYAGASARALNNASDAAAEELDGPMAWMAANPGYVIGAVVLLYALTAAGPALELADKASGGN